MLLDRRQSTRARQLVLALFLLLFLGLVGIFIYKGFFSRYLQDDYCYGATLLEKGFFNGVIYPYFHSTEYNGNRYSLTLFAGIFEVTLGTTHQSWYAAIILLSWLAGLTFLVSEFFKKFHHSALLALSLLVASVLMVFTLYLAPDLYQVLYWRNASLTYLAPLVSNTFLLLGAFHASEKAKNAWGLFPLIFLFSLITAGFSETATVWQITVWAMLFILVDFALQSRAEARQKNPFIFTVLGGAVAGAVLLIISPTNTQALTGSSVKMAGPLTLFLKSFRFGFDFLHYSLGGKWLPFGVLFLFGYALKQFISSDARPSLKTWGLRVLVTVLFTYLISVASTMPSVLVRTAYPDGRALLFPHFALVVSMFLLGYFTGAQFPLTLLQKISWLPRATTLLLLAALFLYSARIVPNLLSGTNQWRERAAAWDQRQALIYQERAAGETHLTVPAFDSIGGINELHTEEGHWVNVCAARYYQVAGISAVENYNGVKPYFK